MKKKKGFTLVEVITVIVIISVLSLLIVPRVTTIIRGSKDKTYDSVIETIKDSAKSYAYLNTLAVDNGISSDEYYDVPLITLQQMGLLDTDLVNPKTDAPLGPYSVVRITKGGENYVFTYLEDTYLTKLVTLIVNLNGGSTTQVFSNEYPNGTEMTLLNPSKIGHSFTKWTLTGEGSSITDDLLYIGTNTTEIMANYIANNYVVTFNANGGSTPSTNTKTVTYGETYGDLPTTTKAGYTFAGWYTSASGGTRVDSTTKVSIADNQTLYAHWDLVTYTISYDLNGGTVSGNPTSYNVTTETITLKNPTKTGYTFTGWIGSNGSTAQTTVTIPKGSTGNKTYTAVWTIGKYTVTFNANGGSVSPSSKQVTYGETYGDLPTPTKAGYIFTGWAGKNKFNSSSPNQTLYNLTYTNGTYKQTTADTRAQLQWKVQKFNGDTYVETIANKDQESGRISFTFTKDSTFTDICFGLNGSARDTKTKINVSHLENGKTYTISANILNNTQGSVSWNNVQIEEGSTLTEYETYYVSSSTKVTTAWDHTLTANFILEQVTVTVNGAVNETITVKSGSTTVATITTNSSAKATLTIKPGTYTFTSNLAKSTSSVSSYYSKSITISTSTTTVNFYPDGAVYWFGNGNYSGQSLYDKFGGVGGANVNTVDTSDHWHAETNSFYASVTSGSSTIYKVYANSKKAFSTTKANGGKYTTIKSISVAADNFSDGCYNSNNKWCYHHSKSYMAYSSSSPGSTVTEVGVTSTSQAIYSISISSSYSSIYYYIRAEGGACCYSRSTGTTRTYAVWME